jgi:O-antigen/teichoic acid export membrane protein
LLASKLAFVRHSVMYSIGFVAFVAMTTLILVTDAVFIACRQAKYNLAIDGLLQGVSKLVLPVALVGAGAYGIFAATGFASGVDVLASLLFIFLILGYRPRFRMRLTTLKQAIRFSAANYLANLLNLMPTLVLPIAVLDELGTRPAAYYYVVFAIANLLNAIAYSTCQSLFAEGSHGDTDLRILVLRSARMLTIATIPAGALVAALATTILSLFGRQYEQHATATLVVLALGLVPVAFCAWSITLLRVTRQVAALIAANAVYAATTCGLAIWWARSGLVFVALAWVIGNVVTAVIACATLRKRRERLSWSRRTCRLSW